MRSLKTPNRTRVLRSSHRVLIEYLGRVSRARSLKGILLVSTIFRLDVVNTHASTPADWLIADAGNSPGSSCVALCWWSDRRMGCVHWFQPVHGHLTHRPVPWSSLMTYQIEHRHIDWFNYMRKFHVSGLSFVLIRVVREDVHNIPRARSWRRPPD